MYIYIRSLLPFVRKEKREREKREREISFLKNGSMLLEELIASCDGNSNPIRCYSADELMRATNNFHPSCIVREDYFQMFRGFLGDRSIIISKFRLSAINSEEVYRSLAIRDTVISTQMSNHKNALKLLGCCLEFPLPALVFENAARGPLTNQGCLGDNEPLPWKTRLRIAKQVANALTYLHTAFPRPIIHRDVKPSCIMLDDDYVPKLCNFSLSITIPLEKEDRLDKPIVGTIGYLDPAYWQIEELSEKIDVYALGVLLLVFLTGQQAVDMNRPVGSQSIGQYVKLHVCDGQIQTIVDPKIFEEVGGDEQAQQQLRDFLALALLCSEEQSELRPYMIDIAKELVRIEKSILPC